MSRKLPIRHKVRTYKKENGTTVRSYVRGNGSNLTHLANPKIKTNHRTWIAIYNTPFGTIKRTLETQGYWDDALEEAKTKETSTMKLNTVIPKTTNETRKRDLINNMEMWIAELGAKNSKKGIQTDLDLSKKGANMYILWEKLKRNPNTPLTQKEISFINKEFGINAKNIKWRNKM